MTETLDQARERRAEEEFDRIVDSYIDERLAKVQLAAPISPQAKIKLRGILKKYAKDPHPFRACVKDNMKRFGPGRTEAVCATLKDTIRGSKDWRGKGSKLAEETDATIDSDVLLALDAISTHDLKQIFLEARALELYGSAESAGVLEQSGQVELTIWGEADMSLAEMSSTTRKSLPDSAFAMPGRSYPIHDRAHAANALARASGKPEYSTVKAKVCARYSDMPACKGGKKS